MSITPPASFDTLFKTYSGCVYVTNAGNPSITMREVIITSIFWGLDQKTFLFEGLSWFRFNYLGLVLGMTSKYDSSLAKGLKLRVRKFWRLISTFKKPAGENVELECSFWPLPLILNRIKTRVWFHRQFLTFRGGAFALVRDLASNRRFDELKKITVQFMAAYNCQRNF